MDVPHGRTQIGGALVALEHVSTFAVIHASQLVTLEGPARPRVGPEMDELGIIEDGAMILNGADIQWVGKTDDLPTFSGETIDVAGHIVTPGFVDAHSHPVFGGNRASEFEMRCGGATYEEIALAGGGIRSTVSATRALSDEHLLLEAVEHVRWMIEGGTTAIEAKSGYGLSLEAELAILGVIGRLANATGVTVAPTFLGAHAVPNEFAGRKEDYVDHIVQEMLPAVVSGHLAEFCDVFCEPAYFSSTDSRKVLNAAAELGLKLKVHADQLTLSGGAQLAAEVGALTADHLEQADADGIWAMQRARVIPVLLPGSVYALGLQKYPDAREMLRAGLPVVLATDFNPGSSPTPSIPMVMSLACTQMKMTPAEAMTATTVNAAFAIGRGGVLGSLEVGKRADFAVHGCSDYRELAYFFGFNKAEAVYAGGQPIYSRT